MLLQQTRRRLVSCGQFFDTTLGSDWLVIEPISVSCDLCEDPAIFPLIIDHLFQVTTSADGILRLCRDFFYRSDHDVSLSTYILLCLSTLQLNYYNVCHITRPQVMNGLMSPCGNFKGMVHIYKLFFNCNGTWEGFQKIGVLRSQENLTHYMCGKICTRSLLNLIDRVIC